MNKTPSSRVLIVEDDPGVAELQRRWLDRAGFQVVIASTIDQALTRMAEHTDIALVVLDYRLPGDRTGLDFQRLLRARGYELPVIMVSGSTDQWTAIEALRLGIEDFVPKSGLEYLDYLPAAVRSTLERSGSRVHATVETSSPILIVEDDAGIAELERRSLELAGYSVRVVGSVREAQDALEAFEIGLVVLDQRLPDGNGLELHQRMRKQGRDVPAILVTAYSDEPTVIAALRAGIRDFIPKTPGFLDDLPLRAGRVLEQTRLERALRRSEERYRRVLATANEGIWLLDSESRITFVNERMAALLGYAPTDLMGRHSWEFAPPEDRARFDALFERRRSGLMDQADLRFRHRDGRDVWLILAGRPIHDERGAFQGALDMFTDVTDRKRAEDEVRRLNAELEGRVAELQALLGRLRETDRRKDEFLAMLGHELRNPLAAITNAIHVLRLVGPQEPRLTWARDVIQRQSESLARMLDDLLDISRIDRGAVALRMERVELAVILAQALETCRHAVEGKRQRLHVRMLPDPVPLDADITRLTQVVANLLNNASKFTPAGGEIWLEVERDDDQVVVRVRDTGIGIEAAMLPRVFELFAQADQSHGRSFGGLGVGLTLVERLVALHRGTVSATSAGLDQGSEFVVRLPAATGSLAPRRSRVPASRPRTASQPLQVLVVDDDNDVGEGTAKLLELLGNHAEMVASGPEALDAVRVDVPDVILIDIGMPEMDGYELVRRLRAEPGSRETVLVAVTGYGQPEDRKRTREAGFDAHLVKPVTLAMLETLLDGIRTRDSRPRSERVASDTPDRSR